MNIHEYQAKDILKEFGAPVTKGVAIFDLNKFEEKIDTLKTEKLVLKAQIHAGGRGKAGGVKLVSRLSWAVVLGPMFAWWLLARGVGGMVDMASPDTFENEKTTKISFLAITN